MKMGRTILAAAAMLMAGTSLALADGELNIYNWGNYTSPDMIKKFEQKYNVKVTITDYDSNDTALAKIRQGGHGFDIAVPSQHFLDAIKAEAEVRNMTVNSFMRAMIRGYFGAALHGR